MVFLPRPPLISSSNCGVVRNVEVPLLAPARVLSNRRVAGRSRTAATWPPQPGVRNARAARAAGGFDARRTSVSARTRARSRNRKFGNTTMPGTPSCRIAAAPGSGSSTARSGNIISSSPATTATMPTSKSTAIWPTYCCSTADASQLATVEYDSGPDNRYEMWSLRPSLVNVAISSSAETAVIDVDSTGRMWVAYDTSSSDRGSLRRFRRSVHELECTDHGRVRHQVGRHRVDHRHAERHDRRDVVESEHERFGFRLHVDGAAPKHLAECRSRRPASRRRIRAPAWPTITSTWPSRRTARSTPR